MTFDPQAHSQQIIDFIRHVFTHTRKSTAIIGLSGGIDSAVAFVLTTKALGADHVHAYHLPSKTTHPQHLQDIQQLMTTIQFPLTNFHIIPISGIIQKTWRIIKRSTDAGIKEFARAAGPRLRESSTHNSDSEAVKKINQLRLANLSARIRMLILFDAAKQHDGLVVGTENKSESMLGYFTRFGDAASDLEPISHLYKTQVIQLTQYLHLPPVFLTKPPSADLWHGQTDAAELGFSYAQADPILMQLAAGQQPHGELAQKVISIVNQNTFKHRAPYTLDNLLQ